MRKTQMSSEMKKASGFNPTHRIIVTGGEAINGKEIIFVQEIDGVLLTEGEFETESLGDWEFDNCNRTLLWQGSFNYPYKTVTVTKI